MARASFSDSTQQHSAPWVRFLLAADHFWTRFETAIVLAALGLEISSMSLWVFLKGFSTPAENESRGGIVLRAVIGALLLGLTAHFGLRRAAPRVRVGVTVFAIAFAVVIAKRWASVGVDYTSNVLNWLQQASVLSLFGGLRGVGTRLTVLLTLVGGSLATARGKHIVFDVATRFVRGRWRSALVVAGWLVSATVSAAAAWGFLDHVAIENFEARAESSAGQKLRQIGRQLREDWFIVTTQIALDMRSTRHVLFEGKPYSEWFRGKDWNAWLVSAGLVERYGPEATRALQIPPDEFRAPLIVIPGRGEPRGELTSAANLLFPFGLLVIAVRFLLRGLLVVGGGATPEPDDSDEPSHQPSAASTP